MNYGGIAFVLIMSCLPFVAAWIETRIVKRGTTRNQKEQP